MRLKLSPEERQMLHEAVNEYVNYQVGSGAWTAGEADAFGWTMLTDKLEKAVAKRQPSSGSA